jgi:tripartite-type tricarboxylate transporter receptor subunit TctC
MTTSTAPPLLKALAAFVLCLSVIVPCGAQTYPDRLIRIVVPFPAGGPTDVMARLIAQSLAVGLGQNVVIDNQAGAGGRIGSKSVAGAAADGYTLLLGGTNVNAITPALYRNLSYDPVHGFVAVAAIASDSMVLVVTPSLAARTLQELIRLAKDNPGRLKYGAPPGISSHFAGELLKIETGTDIVFVPYKGGAPAITDVLGGHIDMTFNNKSVLLAHIQDGRLRALAVAGDRRWPELPDVPTLSESGLDGFPAETWYGLLAPVGTPRAIVDRLNGAVNDGLRSAEVRATLASLGIEGKIRTPAEFAAVLADQTEKWQAIVKATGITVE